MSKSWNDLAALEVTNEPTGNNLLLIDGNNLAYRFLRHRNSGNYSSDYVKLVQSLAKSYNASKVIVCFDFGKSYYRLNLLEDYKGTREKPSDPDEIKKLDEFFAVMNLLPEVLPYTVLKFRGIEADDLIAYLSINLSDDYDHTWIVSSDKDLIQLITDGVSIFNLFSRKERTIDSIYEDFELTPIEFMHSRIIEGDKSDNIMGIEGIGPKRAQTLIKTYGTVYNVIDSLPISGTSKYIKNLNEGKDKLINNELLINLADYHEDAILAGKDGEQVLDYLVDLE